jgi:hypothetical protein
MRGVVMKTILAAGVAGSRQGWAPRGHPHGSGGQGVGGAPRASAPGGARARL